MIQHAHASSLTEETKANAAVPRRAWASMLLRALPALLGAAVITFSADHSPKFGYLVFGACVLLSGILVAFEAIGIRRHPTRLLTFARGVLSVIAGGTALVLGVVLGDEAKASGFILLVAVWAFVTGAIEMVSGWMARRRGVLGRDAMLTGALTLLLGLIVVIVPPDLRQEYGGLEQVQGALTAATQAVGFVGAYFALLGVLLIIEGFSLRLAQCDAACMVDAHKEARS